MTTLSNLPIAARVQALVDQIQPGCNVEVLRATHEKAFPKQDHIDLYRVEFSRSGLRQDTTLTVHCLPRERRVKARAKLANAALRLSEIDPNTIALYGEAPAAEALLYTFPLDPTLKRLADAVSPKRIAARLGAPDAVYAEVVRYVPSRRCQLRWLTAEGALYAKLYQDARGEYVFRVMQWLHSRIAASGHSQISTPAPVAYWADWSAVVQQAAPGGTLHALCGSGQADADSFALAGKALAVLHGATPSRDIVNRTHSPLDELEVAGRWARLAAQHKPGVHALGGLLAGMFSRADRETSAATAVHRDCYDRQFLLNGDHAAIIDLDELSIGEPELDLANFLAHMELRCIQGLVSSESAASFRTAFLDAYRETSGRRPSEGRLRFYLATSLIRLAALYSMRPGEESSFGQLRTRAGEASLDIL